MNSSNRHRSNRLGRNSRLATAVAAAAPAPASTPQEIVPSERAMGQSGSNFDVTQAAGRLVKIYREMEGLPSTMTFEEMTGDNAHEYLNRFARFLSSRVIPFKFNDNLEPQNPNEKRKLVPSTLALYLGNHFTQIRKTYPNHPDWISGELPSWWYPLRNDFIEECKNFQQKYCGDAVFGSSGCNGLYRTIKDQPFSITNEGPLENYVSEIDMRYCLRRIACNASIQGNSKCQDRVLL